jgi:hypothetical protein
VLFFAQRYPYSAFLTSLTLASMNQFAIAQPGGEALEADGLMGVVAAQNQTQI